MLKQVKIQGYKSLVDVEVCLQPLSVLFGPNAAGKSNFLDALQLLSKIVISTKLKDAFASPYRGTPLKSFTFGPAGVQGLLMQERASFTIEVDIELSQSAVDIVERQIGEMQEPLTTGLIREKYLRYRITVEILPKTGSLRVASEYLTALNANGEPAKHPAFLEWNGPGQHLQIEGRRPYRREYLDHSILSTSLYPDQSPHLVALREELASWFFFFLEPRERMRAPTPVKEVRHIGLMGEELAAFLNTLRALDEPQFKAVEKALHLIIPSITGIDIKFNSNGEIELTLRQGQTPIPARVLSEGTLRILGLLALGGAKESPALLGFEEPENGIHPDRLDLIVLLLKNLTNNDTQVIATSHSPTLLDLIPEESLYVFDLKNGNTIIEPYSKWSTKENKLHVGVTSEDTEDIPVSQRLLRGDFYA